jgi:hypothetical protein
MPTPSTSAVKRNIYEIISKKHDLSRKRITTFHVTNPPQDFCVARKLGIECINLNFDASAHTTKMGARSSSEIREQITNQDGTLTYKSATFNVYFNIRT